MEWTATRNSKINCWVSSIIRQHLRLLGHQSLGVTELRTFDPIPMVAYVDNEDDAVRLCQEMDGKTAGIYVGVQPRPAHFYDLAPNRWMRARSGKNGNCARDIDIEYITLLFFDIDVVSDSTQSGHPASNEELKQSLHAAELLCREDGLALNSTIGCSGNGHYGLVPIVPIPVDCDEIGVKFKRFCRQLAETIACQVHGVKLDPVYNLSRVMRVMGTFNRKGQPVPGRPHRRAHFVTEPVLARSMALHHMIRNTEIEQNRLSYCEKALPQAIKCNLSKIERCCFIQYCRAHPEQVSEPQWWAMITNLARLEGGPALIHEISRLDHIRYDYANTERVVKRVLTSGYRPVSCETLMNSALTYRGQGSFNCPQVRRCPAWAPMYMSTLHTIYKV